MAIAVAPHAVRPIADAPVATPLSWKDLDSIKSAQQFTIRNIFKRLDSIKDPWKDLFKLKQID
ncbi:hypothetical protein HYX58_02460 [Candidatus Dependentiae bacterium]|nr:hypothetical protein [Candidatus Dependentiae bacterium]